MRGKKGDVFSLVLRLEKREALASPPFVVRGRSRLPVAKKLLAHSLASQRKSLSLPQVGGFLNNNENTFYTTNDEQLWGFAVNGESLKSINQERQWAYE